MIGLDPNMVKPICDYWCGNITIFIFTFLNHAYQKCGDFKIYKKKIQKFGDYFPKNH